MEKKEFDFSKYRRAQRPHRVKPPTKKQSKSLPKKRKEKMKMLTRETKPLRTDIRKGPHTTGAHDTGAHDTGPHDTGPHDTGAHDTGPHDTGAHDTGPQCAGPHAAGPQALGAHMEGPHTVGEQTIVEQTVGEQGLQGSMQAYWSGQQSELLGMFMLNGGGCRVTVTGVQLGSLVMALKNQVGLEADNRLIKDRPQEQESGKSWLEDFSQTKKISVSLVMALKNQVGLEADNRLIKDRPQEQESGKSWLEDFSQIKKSLCKSYQLLPRRFTVKYQIPSELRELTPSRFHRITRSTHSFEPRWPPNGISAPSTAHPPP
ncbi:hypothetical protein L345_16117, partial [Ophiophagus hannah]